jgi:hypothetical protein
LFAAQSIEIGEAESTAAPTKVAAIRTNLRIFILPVEHGDQNTDRRVGSWPEAGIEPVTKCNGEFDPGQIVARIFDLTVPNNLLSTADEVIE